MPFDHARRHQPVESPGEPLGDSRSRSASSLIRMLPLLFGQLDQDLVVGDGDALTRLEIHVEPGEQAGVGPQQ